MVITGDDYIRGSTTLRVVPTPQPKRILFTNSKGGCGKTTLATNLAAWFANGGKATALVDHDPQASSSHWLQLRPQSAAAISGIAAYIQPGAQETRSFRNRLPRGTQRVVIDTPAGLGGSQLYRHTREADLVIVPIVPSSIDIHAAARFIRDLGHYGLSEDGSSEMLVVANRVREHTVMFSRLNDYLQELGLPRVTFIRDSQLYTRAAELGLGVCDLRTSRTRGERDHWARIGAWIENRFALNQHRADAQQSAAADHLASGRTTRF